ncbi:MAG: hypothetical protein ACLTSZ_08975 [Lachnospiraceae bacterium]
MRIRTTDGMKMAMWISSTDTGSGQEDTDWDTGKAWTTARGGSR